MPRAPGLHFPKHSAEDAVAREDTESEKLVKSTKKVLASAFCTVVFYFLFIFSLTLHHVTDETYKVRSSFDTIRELQITRESDNEIVISKGWHEITSLAEMSLWLRDSFVPTLWKDSQSGRGLVLDANRVIGGVFLQQEKLEERTCRSEKKRPKLYAMYNSSCYEDQTLSVTALAHVGPSAQTWNNRHVYWLDITQNLSLAQDHIDRMISAGWTSIATKKVSVQSVFYNAQLEVFVFFEATFQVNRPGSLVSGSQIWTMPEFVYEGGVSSLTMWVDLSFCICLGIIAVLEVLHFIDYCREGKCCVYILSLYRLASIGLILGGIGFMSVFYWISYEIEDLARRVGGLVEAPGRMEDYLPGQTWSQAWISRHQGLNELFSEMARVSQLLRWTQLMALWYGLAIMLRLCEGFELSPHMGSVIRTLKVCLWQLFYFIIVFLVCFLNFAISAHFLFGHMLEEWSTIFFSVSSAFRAIMGDMDFMSMYDIAPVSALSWFILFVLCIVFILVNQFIVIIMDAYQEIQGQNRKAQKVVSAFQENLNAVKMLRAKKNHEEKNEIVQGKLFLAGPESSEKEKDEDDEVQHGKEQNDSFDMPQEKHVGLDFASPRKDELFESPRLPHAPEAEPNEEKPSLPTPLDLYSTEADHASTHSGGVNSIPLSIRTGERPKEDKRQQQLEHSPQHESDGDEPEMTPQSRNIKREVPLQGNIMSQKFPRGVPTVQARVLSRRPDIIAKATPL